MTALLMGDVRPESVVSIEFAGTTTLVVMHEGQPFVAIRPICDALMLDWTAQLQRIKRHPVLSEGVVIITTPSEGGAQATTCLLLEYFNG